MKIHIIIASNYFSQTLADLHISDGYRVYYHVRTNNKLIKVLKILLIISISWLTQFFTKWDCLLYLPHSYGRFGLIRRYCYYDQLLVIEDGIALMSVQQFQENYIFNLFQDKKFTAIVACEDHVIGSFDHLNINVIQRVDVTKRMMKSYRGQSISLLEDCCALLIDNGSWSLAQIEKIRGRLNEIYNLNSLVVPHPARKTPLKGYNKLKDPVEILWFKNQSKIPLIVTAFSTAAVNIKSFRPEVPVVFVYPDARVHAARIHEFKSEIIDLEVI